MDLQTLLPRPRSDSTGSEHMSEMTLRLTDLAAFKDVHMAAQRAGHFSFHLDFDECDQVGGTWTAMSQNFRTHTVLPVRRGRQALLHRVGRPSPGRLPPTQAQKARCQSAVCRGPA